MATFHLQIVTPDRMVFDGQAQKVIVRTVNGDVCILARHIDYAAPLGIGEARMTDEQGNVRRAACNSGLISVSGGECRIMATTFEWGEDIDRARAELAKENAQQKLTSLQRSDDNFAVAEARLKRALARIQATD